MSDAEIVRRVTARSVRGWHDLPQEDYEAADVAVERLESQNQALQERAEKAEALLRTIAFDDQHKLQAWLQPLYPRELYVKVLVDKATDLLSPTQETDPDAT